MLLKALKKNLYIEGVINTKKQRCIGWGYAKDVIREYEIHQKTPHKSRLKPFQERAVKDAIEQTKSLSDGTERLKLIDLVFWKQSHTLFGASYQCNISYETAVKWHGDFIKAVGKNLGIF